MILFFGQRIKHDIDSGFYVPYIFIEIINILDHRCCIDLFLLGYSLKWLVEICVILRNFNIIIVFITKAHYA
jgi:hypothetical protein